MFHHPAWAVGSCCSGPPVGGTPQIYSQPNPRLRGHGTPCTQHQYCLILSERNLNLDLAYHPQHLIELRLVDPAAREVVVLEGVPQQRDLVLGNLPSRLGDSLPAASWLVVVLVEPLVLKMKNYLPPQGSPLISDQTCV